MILHIINEEKFTKDYISFINSRFTPAEHMFCIIVAEKRKEYFAIEDSSNITHIYTKIKRDSVKLVKYMKKAEKIIFHGLFSRVAMIDLIISDSCKRSYSVLWGGDFYSHDVEDKILHCIKHKLLSETKGIIMELEDDYYLAKQWYNTEAKYFPCMLYFSNIVKEKTCSYDTAIRKLDGPMVIQIGNSADPSNNHIPVMKALSRYAEENISIFLPLSYGNKEYADNVIQYACNIFGDKVNAVTDYLPLDEYLDLLNSVDVAVFNHKRQQGLGNIISLISKGKKVYIPKDVTVYRYMRRNDVLVFPTEELEYTLFDTLSNQNKKNNHDIISSICSEEKLEYDWRRVFED